MTRPVIAAPPRPMVVTLDAGTIRITDAPAHLLPEVRALTRGGDWVAGAWCGRWRGDVEATRSLVESWRWVLVDDPGGLFDG